jgi:hypothetical protein
MIVLGVDPGQTTGWCRYDSEARRVIAAGEFPDSTASADCLDAIHAADTIVFESFREPRGNIYPQTVVAAIYEGELAQTVRHLRGPNAFFCMSRHDVKRILTDAVLREPVCKDDATVWRALLHLHGGKLAAKKGGPLHGVKSHARAALAVAVAFSIQQSTVVPQVYIPAENDGPKKPKAVKEAT